MKSIRPLPALALSLLLCRPPSEAFSCCTVEKVDERVQIADQEVLLVWDESTHTEHFIRRARFQAGKHSGSFGFLVPTPTTPTFGEVKDEVFGHLDELTRPQVLDQYDFRWSLILSLIPTASRMSAGVADPSDPVRSVSIVARARVVGYDVVVLEADDADALGSWLKDHGFESRPEVVDWARPYVESKWKIAAFTYNPESGPDATTSVSTQAVRVTFNTDKPVFPYRVPSDNRNGGSILRLFFVANERDRATLSGSPWSADVVFATSMGKELDRALDGATPSTTTSGPRWLTRFDDHSWPMGNADLYFGPAETQAAVIPDPIYKHHKVFIPLDVLIVAGLIFRFRREARKQGSWL